MALPEPNPSAALDVQWVVRSIASSVFLLASALVSAQTVGPETMTEALRVLREGGGVALVLRGEDQVRNRKIPFSVNTYYVPATGQTPPKVEVWSYRQGTLDRMLVADGENITRFDPTLNQYSLSPYSTLDGLWRQLQILGGGSMASPLRLLREMTAASDWKPWLGGARLVQDRPLQFSLSVGDVQTLTFAFAEPFDPERPALKEIVSVENRGNLLTVWTMQVLANFSPQEVRFKFTPPAGAKPVASPSSVQTGN